MDKNVVAVIVARGGSVEVPGKNIKVLGGKPLIGYTVEHALNAELVDRVIVYTDSEEIAAVGKQFGADVPFMRPCYLGRDAMMWQWLLYDALGKLEYLGDKPTHFVALAPTYPIRENTLIDASIARTIYAGLDGCISMGVLHSGVWAYDSVGYKCLTTFLEGRPRRSRQPLYQQHYGLATTISCEVVRQCRNLNDGDSINIVVPESDLCCIDINSESDFAYAEYVISGLDENF